MKNKDLEFLVDTKDYEYLSFKKVLKPKKKTYDVIVTNKKTHENLVKIYWYGAWRNYVVDFYKQVIFDEKCLEELTNYLKQLKKDWIKNKDNLNPSFTNLMEERNKNE